MTTYRKYWFMTGALAAVATYAIYQGLVGWAMLKFPDTVIQLICLAVITIFLYAYLIDGLSTTKLIANNEYSFQRIMRGEEVNVHDSIVALELAKAQHRANRGRSGGQKDFGTLVDLRGDSAAKKLTSIVGDIDQIRNLLFFLGFCFTLLSIVGGIGMQTLPTNPEESKTFAFNILRALGYSYLPASVSVVSGTILLQLGYMLHKQASELVSDFEDVLYDVVFLGGPLNDSSLVSIKLTMMESVDVQTS